MRIKLRDYQEKAISDVEEALMKGYKAPCLVLPCGSGKSVIAGRIVERANKKGNHVLFLVHRKELVDQIEETFKLFNMDSDLYEVGMIQTVTRHILKYKEPDLIITDEGHHGVANSYKRVYEHFKGTPMISLTATPIRLNGGGLGEVNDVLIEGPSVNELIEWENLAPFKYYAPVIVDTAKLRIRAGDYVKKDIEELFENKAIFGDVVKHYKKLSNNKKAICYCSSIKQSKEVARIFNNHNIPAKHIDGDTNKVEREETIQEFRDGKILILCNVDLISEGFDVPDCNTAILLRPTKSLSLYIQQSMRAMRYQKGKTAIIIDHVGNVGRFGTPDMEREWSLNPKKDSNTSEPAENPVRYCPNCFMTLPTKQIRCECGYKFEVEEKKVEVIEDSELVEVGSTQSFVIDTREPEDCNSMAELHELGRNMGHKPGWAYYQGKLRGFI